MEMRISLAVVLALISYANCQPSQDLYCQALGQEDSKTSIVSCIRSIIPSGIFTGLDNCMDKTLGRIMPLEEYLGLTCSDDNQQRTRMDIEDCMVKDGIFSTYVNEGRRIDESLRDCLDPILAQFTNEVK